MAKPAQSKGGTARIRFIMLDAEIPEGEISQFTTAIQSALKPATITHQQRLPTPQASPKLIESESVDEAVTEDVDEVDDDAVAAPRAPRERRKLSTPQIISEINLAEEPSFNDYANAYQTKSAPDKYLVVALFFKEQRGIDAITKRHAYTAYRHMKWSLGADDWAWPLRDLKAKQFLEKSGRGEYSINNLGINRVKEMKAGA